jgi:hypothetical protein
MPEFITCKFRGKFLWLSSGIVRGQLLERSQAPVRYTNKVIALNLLRPPCFTASPIGLTNPKLLNE